MIFFDTSLGILNFPSVLPVKFETYVRLKCNQDCKIEDESKLEIVRFNRGSKTAMLDAAVLLNAEYGRCRFRNRSES